MRTTRDVRARRPSPPARRALAQHGAATEEKTRDEDDDRRRDARRVARGSGAFHVRDEEGGAFTICHRRTLRRALSADLPRQRVSMIHRAVLALDCTTLAPTTRTNALSLRNMAVTKSITNDEQHFIITNLTFTTLRNPVF